MTEVEPTAPAIRVSPSATAEQLAAIVAVIAAASGSGDGDDAATGSGTVWAAHAAGLRRPVDHGPAAWRTSLRR